MYIAALQYLYKNFLYVQKFNINRILYKGVFMEEKQNRSNKITKEMITFFYCLSIVFFISLINNIGAYAETTNEKQKLPETYALILQERGGVQEQINGSDIGLKTDSGITFDNKLLQDSINKLSCSDDSKVVQSGNATLVLVNNNYVISKEAYGNKINKDILYKSIVKAIQNGDTILNLEAANCYESSEPRFKINSPAVVIARDTLNRYLASKITYNFGGLTQYLDSSIIKNWIGVDSNFNVTIDENMVRNYVDNIANTYASSLGTSIKVSGGDNGNNHGWMIDVSEETKALIDNIKSGQTISKYPIYTQTSISSYFSNVGDTFVEVDKGKQHLWFYKDGYLVVEGDLVTGNESTGHGTPTGVFYLNSKQRDSVLIGEDYASPVSFWMPFIKNDIGLHDASWRDEFGGEIYKTGGSHGCVNLPYYVAKAIFDNISPGCPVIVHE